MSLLRPVITEHSLAEATKGRFSFVVTRGANRPEIKRWIEETFDVTVKKIETTAIPPKSYRAGKARAAKTTTRGKKAVVTLAKDQKIDLFEVGKDA